MLKLKWHATVEIKLIGYFERKVKCSSLGQFVASGCAMLTGSLFILSIRHTSTKEILVTSSIMPREI